MRETSRWRNPIILVAVVACLAFGTTAFAANTLTVVGPGLNSTSNTMQVNLQPGQTNNVYVESAHPAGETHYLIRFWLDPTGMNLPPNTSVRIGAIGSLSADPDITGQKIVLFLRRDTPAGLDQYQINAWGREDGSGPAGFRFLKGVWAGMVATPGPLQFEVEWTRSTGAASADGIYRVARLGDGGGQQQLTNLQMYDFAVDYIRLGALSGSGGNVLANCFYKLDEFESYR